MLPCGKFCQPLFSATMATDATNAGYVDTLGYDFAEIVVHGPTHAANDLPATLKLSHGTGTIASNGTDIEAFTGGTSVVAGSTGFVIPASTTVVTSGYAVKFLVDCRTRERYLGIMYTPGTATSHEVAFTCNLYRGEVAPDSAADAGVDGLICEA